MTSTLDQFGITMAVVLSIVGVIAIGLGIRYPTVPISLFQNGVEPYMYHLPNTLFVYGFIADILNVQYHRSIQSFTALALLSLVKLFEWGNVGQRVGEGISSLGMASSIPSLFTAAAVGTAAAYTAPTATAVIATAIIATAIASVGIQPSNKCTIPGLLGYLDTKIAPTNIMLTMTVMWYALFEDWSNGVGSNTAFLGITTMLLFIAQCFSYYVSGCYNQYNLPLWAPLIALVLSIVSAVTSFYINKKLIHYSYQDSSAPVESLIPGVFVCPSGQIPDGKGGCMLSSTPPRETPIVVGEPSRQTQPLDDNDQFVCEAYKDGELVTSTIVE